MMPEALHLTEYQTTLLPEAALSTAVGTTLWQQYDRAGRRLLVEFPSPKTGGQWALRPQGWVGHIPLPGGPELFINPRLPLHDLYQIWAYAYGLRSVDWLEGVSAAGTIADFYEQLAARLAAGVQHLARRGLYRAYQRRGGRLAVVRGRMRPPRQPVADPALHCAYDEQTTNLLENQALAAALTLIARHRRCRPPVQREIRRAARLMQGAADGRGVTAVALNRIQYHRLNAAYKPLHALCRFFLEHQGPQHAAGDRTTAPFLLNMALLFERFVAAWLAETVPPGWRLELQEQAGLDTDLHAVIDLVLYRPDGQVYAVLDTKYKIGNRPEPGDINQVIAYANFKKAPRAILIYPAPISELDVQLPNGLQLRTIFFPLELPIAAAGQQFDRQLFGADAIIRE